MTKNGKVPADRAVFLTIGVPAGVTTDAQINRALGVLRRAGFMCNVTSEEALVAAAEIATIRQEGERDD